MTAPTREALLAMSPRELRRVLAAGHPIDVDALADADYRGISLGLPSWIERLSWKTFRKTFRRDPETGAVHGWNERLEQTGLDGPVRPLTKRGAPMTFGPYEVVDPTHQRVPDGGGRGLLIDYGRRNRVPPLRFLRDPIVALEPDDSTRLLGWSYLLVAGIPIPTPSYFLLERESTP